jgi:type III secretion YscU/HrpY family protein
MGEKTEKATPKKLRDAKRKGQVAKAQDFPAAFTFIVSIAVTLGMMEYLYTNIGSFLTSCFSLITSSDLDKSIVAFFYEGFYLIFICSMPVLLIVAIVGVIATFITVGPVWAPEVFKFDIKKFNPVENLKAKFKMKTFVELIKSLLKIFIAGYIVYDVMWSSMTVLTQTVGLPIMSGLLIFAAFLKEVIIKIGIFFISVAVLDLMYQKHTFEKEMMMEKFEVKQEYKDTEGDPLIKSKRRQIAHEIAYQEGPAGAAAKAKAVVTNPTHLAIALGYEAELDPCPFVLAMGQGHLAEQIIKVAEKHKVPIIRNIPLAHKLWESAKLFEYIPEDSYELVAEVLRWIAELEAGLEPTDINT